MKLIVLVAILIMVLVIGVIILNKVDRVDGLLNVDMRDPDKDYYDFVFLIPTGDIPKKKYLKIEVKTKTGNSQGENFQKKEVI